ncbi:hypothetical protein [Arhodomonas sp. AD133]|uniref:hypothetical protein n=1 Tax=Arhodomonas sp. AD133 TaxID=3415009 RepID=UPI003EC0030F
MRRYLAMLAACICLVYCAVWAATELGRWHFLGPEFGMWQAKSDLLAQAGETTPDTLVIGDSRAMAAVRPGLLPGRNVYNLALGGGTTVEAYYVLSELAASDALPETLVLSFAPFHLEFEDAFWARTVAFRFLTPSYLLDLYARGGWRTFGKGPLEATGRYLGLPYYRVPALRKALDEGFHGRTTRRLYRETMTQRGWHLFGDMQAPRCLVQETALESFTPDALLTGYLKRTLEIAQDNGIDIYYVSLPYSTYNISRIRPGYLAGYRSYIADLTDRYGAARIATPAAVPLTMMGDCSHVNVAGAKVLTSLIAQAIRNTERAG